MRIDTATLVNLVTDTRAVPEFLFDRCTADAITPAVRALLEDPEPRRPACGRRRGDAPARPRWRTAGLRAAARC